MLQAVRATTGNGANVPDTAAAKRKVVERMYHQLFQGLSFAYALVQAYREWAVLVNKGARGSLKTRAVSMKFGIYFSPTLRA